MNAHWIRPRFVILVLVSTALGLSGCSSKAPFEFSNTPPATTKPPLTPNPNAPYPDFVACNSSEIRVTPSAPRRLSRLQYEATLIEALRQNAGNLINWNSRSGVLNERFAVGSLATTLAQVPQDFADRTYSRTDTRFTDSHLDAFYAIANQAAEYFLSTPAALESLAGAACVSAPNETCVKAYFSTLARRLFSRPLDTDELNRYWASFQSWNTFSPAERLTTGLRAMLLHPEFLYLFQTRGAPVEGRPGLLKKSPFEMVRQLALQFTDSPPSTDLMNQAQAAAQSGGALNLASVMQSLLQPGYYGSTPNDCTSASCNPSFPLSASQHVMAKFVKEHLEFDRFPGFGSDPLTVASYQHAGELPLAGNLNYYSAMERDLQSLGFRNFWKGNSYSQYLTDPTYSLGFSELSRMYGFSSNTNYPPEGIAIPGRSGPLTRAGFLNSGTAYPNMILLGTKVLRKFMCRSVPDPDPRALPEGFRAGTPRHSPPVSSRSYLTTQTQGNTCIGCHSVINPVGFAFGGFNGLGGLLSGGVEPVWHYGANGAASIVGTPSVDLNTSIRLDGESRAISGAVDLSGALASSEEAGVCYARQIFEFSMGRRALPTDSCSLKPVADRIKNGSMKEAWSALGQTQEILYRQVEP